MTKVMSENILVFSGMQTMPQQEICFSYRAPLATDRFNRGSSGFLF